jgi:hypothetical protein
MMPKQERREGDFISIDLHNGFFSFGRVLQEPLIAFYDVYSNGQPQIGKLADSSVLWRLWVYNYAVEDGRWQVIGNRSLTHDLLVEPVFYKQDPITKAMSLYQGTREWPATLEECEGLECAAVWEPEHIEERLIDHFEGRTNRWVVLLQPEQSND